jgi:outer membrane protein TolC
MVAQNTITLENCYQRATENYPIAKQKGILENQLELSKEVLEKDKLPKLSLNAQATYQSEVTQTPLSMLVPIANPLNKDQYRATLDVNQVIYSGGLINAQSKFKEVQTKTQQQEVEVNLYHLKTSINLYYFGILLLQEKKELLESKKKLLLEKIKEIKTAVKFGAVLPASEQVVEAEIIKINQQLIDLKYDKKKFIQHLEQLTFSEIDENAVLEIPIISKSNNSRPELSLFELQNQQVEASQNILSKTNLPKLNAFAQGGYGNPALNMLENSFDTFYMAGIKLNWNLFDWNKTKKEKEVLEISKQIIASEKETFELNQNRQLQEIDIEIQKMQQQLLSDKEIIELREKIVKSADAQMRNGVITSSEYLNEFTQLFEAKNNQKTHEVQLLLTQVNYQIIKGL